VDGCRELILGNEEKAVHLPRRRVPCRFPGAQQNRLEEAANCLAMAAEKHSRLCRYFSKYGISATMSLPITDEVSAHVGPDLRGVLLGLVEVYQRQECVFHPKSAGDFTVNRPPISLEIGHPDNPPGQGGAGKP